MEAEHYSEAISSTTHAWLTDTVHSGYTGTVYIQALPDLDIPAVVPSTALSSTAQANYPIHFTTPGTYTLWSRSSGPNAAGDSLYVGLNGQLVEVSGTDPTENWSWSSERLSDGLPATLSIDNSGLYTLTATMREDGLRLDRLLLVTDTAYIPSGEGPSETSRGTAMAGGTTLLTRTMVYTYDGVHRLTEAVYSTGESFDYAYDPVGNRVGLTTVTPLSGTLVTTHTFDIANRLTERVVSDGRVYTYTWSAKGELLEEVTQGVPVRTFTYNGAGYLVEASVFTLTTVFTYNGLGIRVAMAVENQPETRYVVDYLDGNRILEESSGTSVTHYVYGASDQVCLGEVNEDDEWTHYLPDGERQVRQTADDEGELAETWLYDPEGTVLEGPQGPLTHLVCNGTYDWSTGLIHTDGGYFDPWLGIWLMMAPLGVIGLWRRRKRGRFGGFEVFLLFVVVGGLVVGCGSTPPKNVPPDPCLVARGTVNPYLEFVDGDKDWTFAEKNDVQTTLGKALLFTYAGEKGFGSFKKVIDELKLSSSNPVRLVRDDENYFLPGGAASVHQTTLDVKVFTAYFDLDQSRKISTMVHEMAHYWDLGSTPKKRDQMLAWINWGLHPTAYGSTNDREDFAESVEMYFRPREFEHANFLWTDDIGLGRRFLLSEGQNGPDQLVLNKSELTKPRLNRTPYLKIEGSLNADEVQVRDRYDWMEMTFTGQWGER